MQGYLLHFAAGTLYSIYTPGGGGASRVERETMWSFLSEETALHDEMIQRASAIFEYSLIKLCLHDLHTAKQTQYKNIWPLKPWHKNAYSPYCSPNISYGMN